MQSSPVMATKFHCTTPVVVYKQRPTLTRSPENFKFKGFNPYPIHNLVIQITSTISTRTNCCIVYGGRWDFTKCINISWRWVSRMISFYLFFLNIVADAQAYDYPSPVFACEDVNNYYANVEHLEGKSLKKRLNSIIGKHQSLSYREVWNALKILDASDVDNPETSSGIVEIYSLKVVPKSLAGKPEGWNREHLWPRSYGLKNGPSLTDIHNIRPADVNVNSSRGNKYYGECGVTSAKCLKPAIKEAALDTETDKDRWAPPKQHRGDIARALMYMSVCYGYRQPDGGSVLHLSDSPKISKSEMGLLSTLLRWNEIDPPSREEKLRNDRVCKFYQHNRNPFVDHPEYATLIWKEHILSHHGFYPLPRNHQIQNNKQVMSPAEPSTSKSRSTALFFFLGGIVMLIILLIIVYIFRKKIKPEEIKKLVARARKQPASTDAFSGILRTISYFDFPTLKKATKNFHQSNLLGRGGFGPVYKGKLKDGRLIAVKRLSLDKSQQGENEFLAEVRLITSVQHRNLVQLVGCCSHGPQRLLVYEYMKNKSLDHIIYGKSDLFLKWSTRFQIIVGIARGLQYLHEDSPLRIIHRDIKASNILLDEKFQPRIGDFGLARFFPEDQAYLSTTFAGTLGYTAPEYAIRGQLSEKADIYSFGVLVLEIISGRKNTDLKLSSEMQYLPEYAWKLYERSEVTDLLDPKLHEDGFEEKDVMQAINVAFLCLQPHANLRPPMSDIVAMLTCKVQMTETLPMKPAFLDRRRKMDENLSWDTMSDVFPSPIDHSESPSLPKQHT